MGRWITIFLLLGCTGCVNHWSQFYQPNRAITEKYPPSTSVEIRNVPFERVTNWIKSETERTVNSRVAIQDLPEAEKEAARDRLAAALQLPVAGKDIRLLGYSEFWLAFPPRLDDGALESFAKSKGADYAVVASTYAGREAATAILPMTTYSQASASASYYGRQGYVGSGYATGQGTSTTFVPTTVMRDKYICTLFLIRKK